MKCVRCSKSPSENDGGWMKDKDGRDWHVGCAQAVLTVHAGPAASATPSDSFLAAPRPPEARTGCTSVLHLISGAVCPECNPPAQKAMAFPRVRVTSEVDPEALSFCKGCGDIGPPRSVCGVCGGARP